MITRLSDITLLFDFQNIVGDISALAKGAGKSVGIATNMDSIHRLHRLRETLAIRRSRKIIR